MQAVRERLPNRRSAETWDIEGGDMTDTAAAQAPSEPVSLAPPEADAEPEAAPEKTARERVIDHLTDSEGDQTIAQIMQGTGLDRGLVDSTLCRAVQRGLVERVGQALYKLAPPKPKPPTEARTAAAGH